MPSRTPLQCSSHGLAVGNAGLVGRHVAGCNKQSASCSSSDFFLFCTVEKSSFDITFMIIVIKLEKHFNVNAWGLLDRALHLKISKHLTKPACY